MPSVRSTTNWSPPTSSCGGLSSVSLTAMSMTADIESQSTSRAKRRSDSRMIGVRGGRTSRNRSE